MPARVENELDRVKGPVFDLQPQYHGGDVRAIWRLGVAHYPSFA